MTAPVSATMAAVLARVSSLEAQFGLRKPPAASASSAVDFESALSGALGAGDSMSAASVDGSITDTAMNYLGVPYVWGGTDPSTGLDCSGFVQNVFRDLGVELPRVSRDQARVGEPVGSLDQARPGDLLFFNEPVSHVAIYLGDNQMIHAAGRGKDVRITDVYETPTHIRRVPAGTSAANGASSLDSLFSSAAARYGVSPDLLEAVARTESGLNPAAVSPAGAQGLMQLMPQTAAGLGVADPFDPAQAVDGAARLLRSHLDRFGSTELALAAYNAGAGAVSRYGGIPPYEETQNYVRRVLDQLGVAGVIDGIAPAPAVALTDPAAPPDSPEAGDLFAALFASMLLPTDQQDLPTDADPGLPEAASPATTAAPAASPDAEAAPLPTPDLAPNVAQNLVPRAERRPDDDVVRETRGSAHASAPVLPARPATTTPPQLPSLQRAPARPFAGSIPATSPLAILPHELPTVSNTTPVAPTTPAAPATPAEPLHEQVALKIRHLAEGPDGTRHLRFELHPQELGHVQIEVHVHDGGRVDVSIRAEEPHAVEALNDSLPDLHQSLDGSGLDVGHVDLDAWIPPGQARHEPDHLPNHGRSPEHRHDLDRGHGERGDEQTHQPDDAFDALL